MTLAYESKDECGATRYFYFAWERGATKTGAISGVATRVKKFPPHFYVAAEKYENGVSMSDIGAELGVTRQAVDQMLLRLGVCRDGMKEAKKAATRARWKSAKDAKAMARYGCTWDELQSTTALARKQFMYQRSNAKGRGIDFCLTFWQWWTIWLESGRYELRGRSGYVMARFGDVGPYAVGNVEIITSTENIKNGFIYKPASVRGKKAPAPIDHAVPEAS